MTQAIGNDFQVTKPQRSLMPRLDFSKVFDQGELLLAAYSDGLPIPFARWLLDFLLYRTARVQISGKRRDPVLLRQDLL